MWMRNTWSCSWQAQEKVAESSVGKVWGPPYNRILRLASIFALAVPIHAQALSVGAKIGAPLTNVVQTTGDIGGRPFHASVKRLAIGPVVDVRLPLGLALEFGAIYKRFDQQAGQYQVIAEPGAPYQVQITTVSKTGGSWEFPIVGQYRFPGVRIRPYLEAGLCFNHLTGVFAHFRTLVSQSVTLQPGIRSVDRR